MNLQQINNNTSKDTDDDQIQQKINGMQSEIKKISEEYDSLKAQVKGVMDEEDFHSLYSEIDTNPEKYINKGGQIKPLAELGVKIKQQKQSLDELKVQQQQIEDLKRQMNMKVSKIVGELLDQTKNKFDEMNNQLQQQQTTIAQLNQMVSNQKSGNNMNVLINHFE